MANPVCRAQERTSALLGTPGAGGFAGVVSGPWRSSAEAPALRAFVAVRVFRLGVLLPAGFLVLAAGVFSSTEGRPSALSAETASVTPYSAPTTRIASARGSRESKVSFTAVAFPGVETPQKLG